MEHNDYWKERFAQLEEVEHQDAEIVREEVEQIYWQTQREIEGKISKWYQRLADNNGISMAEARKMLSKNELKEFKWDVKQYIQHGEENAIHQKWMKELENASARFHISRLEALKFQVQQSLETMFGSQLSRVDEMVKRTYLDSYYHTAYELQKGCGIGWDIAGIDQAQVERIARKPWASDGKNFSERIWSSRQKLISEVHKELTQNILLGNSPQKAITNIAKEMKASRYNAGRLIMTEKAFFSSAAQKDCFVDLGVEQYEIVATLDTHTSKLCQDMDSKVFAMKDYQPGVTAPPFHVFCRSTTVPYFEDDFDMPGERAVVDGDGEIYYIPGNMSYSEWKERFVDKSYSTDFTRSRTKADYLVRSNMPGQDITNERRIVENTISAMPQKVRDALEQGTIIDIGKEGACQYDYNHDILYIAKGADETAVIHEIGHMVENKLLEPGKVDALRKKIVGSVNIFEIVSEIYEDLSKNEVEIFLLKKAEFISDYQGRIYIDSNNIFDAFDMDNNFKDDLLWEFISEGFRVYIEKPEVLNEKNPELFSLIKETIE